MIGYWWSSVKPGRAASIAAVTKRFKFRKVFDVMGVNRR